MRQLLVNIDVDDVNQAVAFYTAAFGVKVGRRFDLGFVELVGLAVPLYLLEKKNDVVVDDMTESFARVVGAGARSESEVIEESYGKGRATTSFSSTLFESTTLSPLPLLDP